MKKTLSRLLCVALIAMMTMSMFATASADGTKVVIPNTAKKLESQLPAREQPVTMRTKTKDGIIMVRVKGDPDEVVAQWMGYDDEYEVVEFENGIGYIETEGHKYQLGAAPNNKVFRNYYAYDIETNKWIPVDYYGSVKVGTTDMKIVTPATKDIGTVNSNFVYDAWVYKYTNTSDKAAKEAAAAIAAAIWKAQHPTAVVPAPAPAKPTVKYNPSTTTGIVAAIPGARIKDNGVNTPGPLTGATSDFWQEVGADGYIHEIETLKDEAGLIIAVNDRAITYDAEGNKVLVAEDIEWRGMVPSYQFYADIHGQESDGSPNYAYSVIKGNWNGIFTRAGDLKYCVVHEENTDYFKTGLAGSQGEVTWRSSTSKGRTVWYLASVTETYAEGDIAAATAEYNIRGQLKDYLLTYRTGEEETYKIKYSKTNKPLYGWYNGFDAWGTEIAAYTNSVKSWRDTETGLLDTSFELDWNLIKLSAFTNPPRKTR